MFVELIVELSIALLNVIAIGEVIAIPVTLLEGDVELTDGRVVLTPFGSAVTLVKVALRPEISTVVVVLVPGVDADVCRT
jgi:hypothetical protein